MATEIWFRVTKTNPKAIPQNGYNDMLSTNPPVSGISVLTDAVTPDERFFLISGIPIHFWSERVAADVTISGEITFSIRVSTSPGFTGRLRAKLYKITSGGSNVETFIGQADALADLVSTSTVYDFSFTPASAVTVARNERFICRVSVMPVAGSFGTDTAAIKYGWGASTGDCSVTFTETVTFRANGIMLFLRGTDSGIDNFRDLSETRTAGSILTGVVATTEGGTDIQWTNAVKIATDISAAAIQSTSNASTYASASFTPVANRLYLLGVVHSDAAPESTVPTVATTTGLAFVQVGNSLPIATIASPGLRLTVFRAQKASGLGAGTFTVTLADAGTGCSARLIEVPNVIATGSDGADAVINVSENSNNASANPSVTMGAFDDASNATFLFVGTNIATVPTGGTGITVLGHSTNATPTGSVAAAWNSGNDSAPDLVLASSAWAAIAVEVVVDPAVVGVLEWITPRLKAPGWTVDAIELFGTFVLYALESNSAANCTLRCKAFRRAPTGDETLVATWTFTTLELITSLTTDTITAAMGVLAQATNFTEDDRIVFRVYAHPYGASTMGGGHTCTLSYDRVTPLAQSDCRLVFLDAPEMKASGDPDKDPALLPSRLPLMGA